MFFHHLCSAASIDIILSFNAWRSLKSTQILRYLLKFTVSVFWVVILLIAYSRSVYYYLVASYLTPNALSALQFLFPPLRRCMERSNWRLVVFLMWWAQPELYVGRGMHEDMVTLMKYCHLLHPQKLLWNCHLVPVTCTSLSQMVNLVFNLLHNTFDNIGVVIAMWAPIVMVYFMDVQIWYAIFSTIIGGISGAFNNLGEIRTLRMLRLRFTSVPGVICTRLVPTQTNRSDYYRRKMAFFSQVWNEFIISLRTEDLISNRERDLLLVPYRTSDDSYIQWPLFLLAIKITIALDMVKGFEGNKDEDLFIKFRDDDYMHSALIECYQTVKDILLGLLDDELDKKIILFMDDDIWRSLENGLFLRTICLSGFPSLVEKLEKLLSRLLTGFDDEKKYTIQIVNALQDLMETILHDVMKNEVHKSLVERAPNNDKKERFELINIGLTQNKSWKQKVARLHLLLTVKDPSFNMPMNLDARRRITFFTNSLFTNMPNAPTVSNMMSFSVLTPYYKEDVLYSEEELDLENEDGISILYYLRKIYPDEWQNFEERISNPKLEATEEDRTEATRRWASYRGQTLSRTVRGMMYYKEALDLQCFLDCADDREIISGYRTSDMNIHSALKNERQQALADLKFTYVVSCQLYGAHKKSRDDKNQRRYADILKLMLTYPSLRVAYIDEREDTVNGMSKKVYYSVLVKGGDKLDEEIYRIKLPGPPAEIGEGKPENQNHAIIFTRGEALQTIDMNQDNYFEEAYKMRNVLEEFYKEHHGERRPTILGLREHIFTGSVSSLAWFMSNQETTFVTIAQRVLADPLRVRFHYGHPDIFDRIFHITRGGVSKASKVINLSEDIFSGYNSTLRGGHVSHHEYIQVGKGRDVGMNQISLFEAKVANGSGEQTLSRDVYRLGQHFDFFRMLSFYFTTVGFYFSSMVTVLVVYVFLYGQTYMVLSGLERQIMEKAAISSNRALEKAIATQSFFQVGLLLVLPMAMETGLESGFRQALGDFIIMQLQLASVFFSFQLGTKAHYYGRAILHGGSKYRATGRGFVIFHVKFAENYRLYSRSHFVKGIELAFLLVICQAYGESYWSSDLYSFINLSIWFLVLSWLFAPFVFNPSGFDWQKTVEDWTDWKQWMGNSDWNGFAEDKSWVSWWNLEQEHLKYTNIRGRCMEIVLAFRFFFFQYGLVYHLNIAHGSRSLMVYGLSWFVMIPVLLSLKMISMGRQYIWMEYQFVFRVLKALLFLGCLSTVIVLFVVCGLTYSDIFVSFLAFLPTGWAFLLIGQACRPYIKDRGLWDSITEMGHAYEWLMGLAIFLPIAVLSWFSFVSEFQTRLLFNQAFSRGLQISMILVGRKDKSNVYEFSKQDTRSQALRPMTTPAIQIASSHPKYLTTCEHATSVSDNAGRKKRPLKSDKSKMDPSKKRKDEGEMDEGNHNNDDDSSERTISEEAPTRENVANEQEKSINESIKRLESQSRKKNGAKKNDRDHNVASKSDFLKRKKMVDDVKQLSLQPSPELDMQTATQVGNQTQTFPTMLPHLVQKREKRITMSFEALKSPYLERPVAMRNKITIDEKILAQYIFAPIDAYKIIFKPGDGSSYHKFIFEGLYPGIKVSINILEAWIYILNIEEKKRGLDSPFRLFCQANIVPIEYLKNESGINILTENLDLTLKKYEIKSINDIDLLFTPIVTSDHIYVICFNLKTMEIDVLDNINILYPRLDTYDEVPIKLRDVLYKYMLRQSHPMAENLITKQPVRVKMHWQTSKNGTDCGIFTMRHMETYMSTYRKIWVTDFNDESENQQAQINDLRYKYLAKILLSDVNHERNTVNRLAREFDHLDDVEKAEMKDDLFNKLQQRQNDIG
ncbi:putative 1,3-beta-glucan synthase [Helianthus debilis subsp. tardiflorus]